MCSTPIRFQPLYALVPLRVAKEALVAGVPGLEQLQKYYVVKDELLNTAAGCCFMVLNSRDKVLSGPHKQVGRVGGPLVGAHGDQRHPGRT